MWIYTGIDNRKIVYEWGLLVNIMFDANYSMEINIFCLNLIATKKKWKNCVLQNFL